LPLDPLQALSGYDGSLRLAGAAGLLPAVLLKSFDAKQTGQDDASESLPPVSGSLP
jgi:hypothetical protein